LFFTLCLFLREREKKIERDGFLLLFCFFQNKMLALERKEQRESLSSLSLSSLFFEEKD